MIVLGGEDNKVPACFAPSLLLGLMAENEKISAEQFGHFIELCLGVFSAPGQKVTQTRFDHVIDFQLSVHNLPVEFVDVPSGGK